MEFIIRTGRLELIAGSAETVRAELQDHPRLAELLDAEVPPEWPPDLNDLHMKELSIRWFENHPGDHGWLCWYFVLLKEPQRTLIGIGGFSDVPDASGTVEVGYSILPNFQRRGYATEALQGLVSWAFDHADVKKVVAEIHPGYEGSSRVLEKGGFIRCSEDTSTGIILYEVDRSTRITLNSIHTT